MRPLVLRPLGHRVAPNTQFTPIILIAPCGEQAQSERQRNEHHPSSLLQHRVNPDRGQRHDRGQREVHPVFDDHLDPARHDAGGGQDREKPRAQKTDHRPPAQRDQYRHRQSNDEQGVQRDLCRVVHPDGAVFKHEWIGPHRQPHIAADRLELRQPVRPWRDPDVEARRAVAIPAGARHQTDQHQPGRRQRRVQSSATAPGLPKRPRHKRPVIEQHEQRRGHHHFLGAHAEQAGPD